VFIVGCFVRIFVIDKRQTKRYERKRLLKRKINLMAKHILMGINMIKLAKQMENNLMRK